MSLEPLEGLSVVDLYAGSGALGIEALSRGAIHADFVESGRPARQALEANLAALDLGDRATVWPLVLPEGLIRLAARIRSADLILLDPPYGGALANATLAALGTLVAPAAGARVVVEHHAKDALAATIGCLERARERRYGETMVTTYRCLAAAEEIG